MKVIRDGFTYELENFEDKSSLGQIVKFIERERDGDSTFLIQDGTTVEELVAVVIHRLEKMNSKLPSSENFNAITNFKQGLFWLVERQVSKSKKLQHRKA